MRRKKRGPFAVFQRPHTRRWRPKVLRAASAAAAPRTSRLRRSDAFAETLTLFPPKPIPPS
jgi:hypothetical protein